MPKPQLPLIVLAAAGGAIALGAIVVTVVVVRSLTSDVSSAASSAPGEGAKLASAGMQAPGTSELRKLGCDPAIVLDMNALLGDASAVREGEPRYIVTCDVPGTEAPTCERAAAAYFAALGGSAGGNVVVRVARSGSNAPLCSHLYAPSGAERTSLPR